jgi:membrane protein YqaA with SNARE-associated domain
MRFFQGVPHRNRTTAAFAHFGAFGLFAFAVLDSSPIPTFGGADILTIILVATRPHPWYEFAAAATAGSVVGAYITYRLARKAGRAYLTSKVGKGSAFKPLALYEKWGTGALIASTAVPFPLPTGIFFAAAGASGQPRARTFLTIVAVCRGIRYSVLALVAHLYGRHIIRILRHPAQYWHWLLFFAAAFVGVASIGIWYRRSAAASAGTESAVS